MSALILTNTDNRRMLLPLDRIASIQPNGEQRTIIEWASANGGAASVMVPMPFGVVTTAWTEAAQTRSAVIVGAPLEVTLSEAERRLITGDAEPVWKRRGRPMHGA